jgi:acetate kinase
MNQFILCLNSGSSSLKFALYDASDFDRVLIRGAIEKIGLEDSRIKIERDGRFIQDKKISIPTHPQALFESIAALKENKLPALTACVHRIVHGGPQWVEPVQVDPSVRGELQKLVELAPLHLPSELAVLDATALAFPDIPQIACFDTAFHQRMPDLAKRLPLPKDLWSKGIRRYGFHGLSFEFIVSHLGANLSGRSIIAHLGNGCSMVALKDGIPQDTTMGLTPTGGLVMGSRSGDLDPGILFYLMRAHDPEAQMADTRLAISQTEHTLNYESGLLGVSGISRNMEELLKNELTDTENSGHAREAIELFCYSAKKFVGSLCSVLGGLDHLVFTGGIGENSPVIRKRICAGLEFLGIQIDATQNAANAPIISPDSSACEVRTLHTDENLMMAHHAAQLLLAQGLRNNDG